MELFQFDFDLTFGVFFLNADKTIYARYGTRDGKNADDDVSLDGLAETMRRVLEIHQAYPNNASLLEAKQPLPAKRKHPEDYSHLDHFKADLNYQGQVAKSCVHCHQVREAMRREYREAKQSLPEKLMFPYPPPALLGITFDVETANRVNVSDLSAASNAGLKKGDRLEKTNGQLISSEADFRWMLHNTESDVTSIDLEIDRNGTTKTVSLELPSGWKKQNDLTWRPTTWDLRRMSTGGISLEKIDDAQRSKLGVEDGKMALLAKRVGKYGDHARARRAGLRPNDIIIGFGGQDDLMTPNALIEFAIQQRKPGDRVKIEYLRNGEKKTATIRLQ